MIIKRVLDFKCDACGKKGTSQAEKQDDDYGGTYLRMDLPPGWEGRVEFVNFCSKLCEAEYEFHQAKAKREVLLRAKQ